MWRYCGTWYCRPLKFFFTWVFRLMQDSLKNASDYGKLVSLHLHLVPPSSHHVFNSVIFQICDCIQYSYFRKHSIMKNNLVILRWIFVSKKFVLLFTSCIIDRSGFAFYWTIRIFAFFTVFFYLLNESVFWALDVTRTASCEITLIHVTARPSVWVYSRLDH